MFHKVVRWHEWGEVENIYIAHNSSQYFINLPKVIKTDETLRKFWQKNVALFFWDTVYIAKLQYVQ